MIKRCLICQKDINRRRSTRKERRSANAVTCSRYCSRIYLRVNRYIKGQILRKKLSK